MAVYTEVSFEEVATWLQRLGLGQLHTLEGCAGGIENTNYFASTDQGDWVLTLFERLGFEQLPFYLQLMKHLAHRGVPVPDPQPDAQRPDVILHRLKDKPAAVVNRLRGKSQMAPQAVHCHAMGGMLARMHLQARDFDGRQPNLRGLDWWNETVPVVLPHLDGPAADLLRAELAFQNHTAASSTFAALPRGPVHADLFRDNAMFDGDELTGVFDFYFAGVDTWLFDLAVCLNDWCIDLPTGTHDASRAKAFLTAYSAVRPLTAAERALLPAMLRAGALRFWISRLWDWHLPREASMLKPHDPTHFERVLRDRVAHPVSVADLLATAAAPTPA